MFQAVQEREDYEELVKGIVEGNGDMMEQSSLNKLEELIRIMMAETNTITIYTQKIVGNQFLTNSTFIFSNSFLSSSKTQLHKYKT